MRRRGERDLCGVSCACGMWVERGVVEYRAAGQGGGWVGDAVVSLGGRVTD